MSTKKLVKHAPPRLVSHANTNTLYISSTSKPLGVVNKVKKHFAKHRKSSQITVKGMGKAMEKAATVAVLLQSNSFRVALRTGTVMVTDELDDNVNEPVTQQRPVSYLELTIYTA